MGGRRWLAEGPVVDRVVREPLQEGVTCELLNEGAGDTAVWGSHSKHLWCAWPCSELGMPCTQTLPQCPCHHQEVEVGGHPHSWSLTWACLAAPCSYLRLLSAVLDVDQLCAGPAGGPRPVFSISLTTALLPGAQQSHPGLRGINRAQHREAGRT